VLPLRPAALLFDMDGLMVDSEPLWWRVERGLAARHGHEWTDAMAASCVGTGFPNTIATMNRNFGLALDATEGTRWLGDAFVRRVGELALKPGCRELVAAATAAGLRLAVASSSALPVIEAVLAHFALAASFAAVVSGKMVPRPKPAPDVFLEAARRLSCEPARAVVLEDSLPGVRAARAAAMAVIAVPERSTGELVLLADHVVADLHEARRLLGL
jgi:HAD superfamily hydrolase (TIGR01509 family)